MRSFPGSFASSSGSSSRLGVLPLAQAARVGPLGGRLGLLGSFLWPAKLQVQALQVQVLVHPPLVFPATSNLASEIV